MPDRDAPSPDALDAVNRVPDALDAALDALVAAALDLCDNEVWGENVAAARAAVRRLAEQGEVYTVYEYRGESLINLSGDYTDGTRVLVRRAEEGT